MSFESSHIPLPTSVEFVSIMSSSPPHVPAHGDSCDMEGGEDAVNFSELFENLSVVELRKKRSTERMKLTKFKNSLSKIRGELEQEEDEAKRGRSNAQG